MKYERKAFEVTFAEKYGSEEIINACRRTVWADSAVNAIIAAHHSLTKKDQKTHFATDVSLLAYGFDN